VRLALASNRLVLSITLAAAVGCARVSAAQEGAVETLPVQGNVYMLAADGGNIAVSIGDEGVMVVDTGSASMSSALIDAVRKLSNKPVRMIVNTDGHPDRVGGNEAFAKIGRGPAGAADGATSVIVIAHESILTRMSAKGSDGAMPVDAWPTATFVDEQEAYFNGESIQIVHQPAAHSDSDSIVMFRRSDVVAAGDIFNTDRYPVIDLARGGSINGVLEGLNRILKMTIPKNIQEDGTLVIPGHGRLSDEDDVLEYRDMVHIVRDRIADMIAKGMTLDQVIAAKPTLDYDPIYGSTAGPWTTVMFIEAAYKSLSAGAAK
jgi:glyoxylase-like metal-dependent hydrolase (beta-lactamase superfamily II)